MFTLDSRGFEDLAKSLIGMEKHFPSVVARTLTLVAQDAKHQVYGWLPKMLDRPTPWTKRSLFVFPAEKSEPVIRAAVVFKHEEGRLPRSAMGRVEASTSMWVQAHGVPRPLKASEKTLRANGIGWLTFVNQKVFFGKSYPIGFFSLTGLANWFIFVLKNRNGVKLHGPSNHPSDNTRFRSRSSGNSSA